MVHGKLGNENMHAQKWLHAFSLQQHGHIRYIQNRGTGNSLSIYKRAQKKNARLTYSVQMSTGLLLEKTKNCVFQPQMMKCQHSFCLDVTEVKRFFSLNEKIKWNRNENVLPCPHPTHFFTSYCSPDIKGLICPKPIKKNRSSLQ